MWEEKEPLTVSSFTVMGEKNQKIAVSYFTKEGKHTLTLLYFTLWEANDVLT